MKEINRSQWVQDNGSVSWIKRIQGTLQFGRAWMNEIQAMQQVVTRLKRVLGNTFVLIRGLTLPGLELEIPGVLIGPPGMYVLYASPIHGVLRINETRFSRMDTTTRQFRDVRPNLVRRTHLMARVVEHYFQQRGIQIPVLEAVLVFTDPGVHVDTARPAVRVVQIDVLERFAARLAQGRRRLSPEDINYLTQMLLHPEKQADRQLEAPSQETAWEDAENVPLGFDEPVSRPREEPTLEAAPSQSTAAEDGTPLLPPQMTDSPQMGTFEPTWTLSIPPLGFSFSMYRRQWLVLAALIGMEFILIIVFLVMVFLTRI